jgi:hypothetical protein
LLNIFKNKKNIFNIPSTINSLKEKDSKEKNSKIQNTFDNNEYKNIIFYPSSSKE